MFRRNGRVKLSKIEKDEAQVIESTEINFRFKSMQIILELRSKLQKMQKEKREIVKVEVNRIEVGRYH